MKFRISNVLRLWMHLHVLCRREPTLRTRPLRNLWRRTWPLFKERPSRAVTPVTKSLLRHSKRWKKRSWKRSPSGMPPNPFFFSLCYFGTRNQWSCRTSHLSLLTPPENFGHLSSFFTFFTNPWPWPTHLEQQKTPGHLYVSLRPAVREHYVLFVRNQKQRKSFDSDYTWSP